MSNILIISVEGIENVLAMPSEAPRYDNFRLPLTLLNTGFSQDITLGKVELSGALRYDQLLATTVTTKEWFAFNEWLHFLHNEGVDVLESGSLVLQDMFGMTADFGKDCTFSVSTECELPNRSLQDLKEELNAIFFLTADNYEGDGDLSTFHNALTDEYSFETPKGADKIIARAMKVYHLLSNVVSRMNTNSGSNNSLVVGLQSFLQIGFNK